MKTQPSLQLVEEFCEHLLEMNGVQTQDEVINFRFGQNEWILKKKAGKELQCTFELRKGKSTITVGKFHCEIEHDDKVTILAIIRFLLSTKYSKFTIVTDPLTNKTIKSYCTGEKNCVKYIRTKFAEQIADFVRQKVRKVEDPDPAPRPDQKEELENVFEDIDARLLELEQAFASCTTDFEFGFVAVECEDAQNQLNYMKKNQLEDILKRLNTKQTFTDYIKGQVEAKINTFSSMKDKAQSQIMKDFLDDTYETKHT